MYFCFLFHLLSGCYLAITKQQSSYSLYCADYARHNERVINILKLSGLKMSAQQLL